MRVIFPRLWPLSEVCCVFVFEGCLALNFKFILTLFPFFSNQVGISSPAWSILNWLLSSSNLVVRQKEKTFYKNGFLWLTGGGMSWDSWKCTLSGIERRARLADLKPSWESLFTASGHSLGRVQIYYVTHAVLLVCPRMLCSLPVSHPGATPHAVPASPSPLLQ